MIPAIYNLKPHVTGSTMEAVNFALELNKERVSLVDASIVMDLTCLEETTTFSTATEELEITDAEMGEFRLKRQIISLPAGSYQYKMIFTFADGSIKQYLKGSWKIV